MTAGIPPAHSGILLLANSNAGSAEDAAVQAARSVLSEWTDVEVAATATGDGLDAVLDRRGQRLLVVAGGDGSLHLVVQRLYDRGELGNAVLGLVPLGTGNDFARVMGIPLDPAAAAEQIRAGRPRVLDLIVDDGGGVVVNAAHIGVGVSAAARAARLKPRLGALAYPVGAVAAGVRSKGWRLRVEVDGDLLVQGRLLMVGIGNGRHIGGGTPLLPDARPADGRLDVVVTSAVGPLARVAYAAALRAGRHRSRPDVQSARGVEVTVLGERFGVNADGELSYGHRRRVWRVEPAAWRLRCG